MWFGPLFKLTYCFQLLHNLSFTTSTPPSCNNFITFLTMTDTPSFYTRALLWITFSVNSVEFYQLNQYYCTAWIIIRNQVCTNISLIQCILFQMSIFLRKVHNLRIFHLNWYILMDREQALHTKISFRIVRRISMMNLEDR